MANLKTQSIIIDDLRKEIVDLILRYNNKVVEEKYLKPIIDQLNIAVTAADHTSMGLMDQYNSNT